MGRLLLCVEGIRKCQGLGSLIRTVIPTGIRTVRGMAAGEVSGVVFPSLSRQGLWCFCWVFFLIVKAKGKNRNQLLGVGFSMKS